MAVERMKVLVGYDGSECAEAALDDLRRAGLPGGTEALVLAAADVFPHLPPEAYAPDPGSGSASVSSVDMGPVFAKARAIAADVLAEQKKVALRGAQRLRDRFPAWKVTAEARAGSPYAALVHRAEEWPADLVVVGSHGRSAPARLVLGSVSQQVLHHAPCSVRVARCARGGARAPDEPTRVVVGIDGSPDAAAALSAVSLRAWPQGTAVQVIAAVDPRLATAMVGIGPPEAAVTAGLGMGAAAGIGAALLPAGRAWARQAVEEAAAELRAGCPALTVIPLVHEGDPKRVLLDVAEHWGADCVFVGAKGHSRLERFLLGSVSSAVAARAKCSVEVVRQGA